MATPAQAQRSTGSVRGVVVDARTGQPLARARVTLDPGTARTTTNDAGRFLLADVDTGPVRLEVSLVGYALARRDVDVPAGASLDLTVPLSEGTGAYTERVEVSGALFPREEPGVAGQMVIGSAELQNLRSLLADDPMRAVQTLPGVGGSDDFRSDFSVRGSDFRHVGVTLDGVPSPLLVHTVHNANDTGSLAMINSDILENVSLALGSYPQRFGNRTGAQVDFRTREGSRARTAVRAAVSAINASIVAEGPIGKAQRGSWLVSGRKSYIDWLIRRIDPETTGTFGFVDAQGKAVYDLTPRHTLQVNVVAGRSRYDEHDRSPSANALETGFNRSVLASATWRWAPSPGLVATQRVYAVSNRFRNDNASNQPLERGSQQDLSYRADVTAAGPRSLVFETGAHVQRLEADGDSIFYDVRGQRFATIAFDGGYRRVGAYGLVRLRPHKALTIAPGVRVDDWELTHETKASPWLQVELGLPRSMLVAAGAGLHRQSPEIESVDGPLGGAEPGAERARHIDVGIGQQKGTYRWQVTAFSREEHGMLREPAVEPRLVGGRVDIPIPLPFDNVLEGSAHGVEASVQRRSANGLSGWIGYAFVSARYDDTRTAESFPADVEQRHTWNVYAHHRLSSHLSVSARFRAATNTPLVGYYREMDGRYFVSDVRNQTRLPFYSRLDLRANRTFDVARGRLTLFVEIINTYNRRNLRGREHVGVDARTGEVFRATEKLFPIVPSAGFLLEF
jgi:Carboxypeptidase regulatory-like domain/TonB-dependent Receptor Plug Domain